MHALKSIKVSKRTTNAAAVDPDSIFSVEGIDGGTVAIASSKKELKQLMKDDADVDYDERRASLTSTTTAPRNWKTIHGSRAGGKQAITRPNPYPC